mmetsp:Transcript_92417/g.287557  ORF Transcript_92417/g.287557 Transcript_92417/m.287557 type:complete len:300 (+) Transcript_92417:74-973(+)
MATRRRSAGVRAAAYSSHGMLLLVLATMACFVPSQLLRGANIGRGCGHAAPGAFILVVPAPAASRMASAALGPAAATAHATGASRTHHESGTRMAAAMAAAALALAGAGMRGRCAAARWAPQVSPHSRLRAEAKAEGGKVAEVDEEEDEDDDYEEEDEFGSIGYETDDDEYAEEGDDEERREARCRARFLPGSPMKFRRVLWQIRGKSYREALMLLEFLPWRHCKPTLKALQSAAANAQNHYNMDKSRLYISMCRAAPGPVMKRMRPVSKGQAHMYKKRTTHLEIRVAEMEDDQLDEID